MLKTTSVRRSYAVAVGTIALGLVSAPSSNALAQDSPHVKAVEQPAPAMDPPVLPEAAAKEVEELGKKIEELQKTGLTAETHEAQDASLDEAIQLAEKVLAIRQEHQGNLPAADGEPELVRWRDAMGEPADWNEVGDARRKVADLRLLRGLNAEGRTALGPLLAMDKESERLHIAGQSAQAQAVVERQLEIRRRVLGEEHPDTLRSISNMGSLLRSQGKLAEAEPYYREAMEKLRRVLGKEHPSTLTSINNMGNLLWAQGKLAEAEPFYREALEKRRGVLGEEHPDTLTSINNMALLLQAQGKLAEAEPFYREALENSRLVSGEEHPDTLAYIAWMGFLLRAQGKLEQAEPYEREALEKSRRVLGEDHPDTLTFINNMGGLLQNQGKLAEAEPYFREAMEKFRRVLGDEHPDTLISIGNMGGLLQAQGKLAEAEPYRHEAVEKSRRVLGEEHPDTITSINNMGLLLQNQGKLAEAEPYSREAMEKFRRVLGDEHRNTLTSISNMGLLLQNQGKLAEAEPYNREALEKRRRVLGEEHPDTLTSINNMGFLLQAQGKLDEAEPYLREALDLAERLRVTLAGDAQTRAQFAGELGLSWIASGFARTLLGLDRADEALGVLERGRSRAALDMFAGGRTEAERALRASGDPDRLASYDAALAQEGQAREALLEAENRLPALRKQREVYEKATTMAEEVRKARLAETDQQIEAALAVIPTRRQALSSATAAVFNELRGLVPAAKPISTEQVLAALGKGQALLSYAWTNNGLVALVARDGAVTGFSLAKSKDDAAKASQAVAALREQIASRPSIGTSLTPAILAAARDAVLPEELRSKLAGVTSLTVIADGTLQGIPLELLLDGVPVAYAPSATIAIDRQHAAAQRSACLTASVVVGDPVFGGNDRPEPKYPETGVLLAAVVDGGNGATGGLRRGDVLLSYNGTSLKQTTDLKPAVEAAQAQLASRGADAAAAGAADRPIIAQVWRAGENGASETVDVKLAPGRLGVQLNPAPPAEGLRSMAFFDRSSESQKAGAAAVEQIRLHGGGLTPLPATRLEASAVAAMLGDKATLLLGAEATAPHLRDAVEHSPPRVLHLATHGLMGTADRPMLASLALSTPKEPSINDTGFLTLEDIFSHWGGSLRGNELVVLSACDTAQGVKQGDTTMALPLGLFVCGTETVIASLWKVDDQATALLMARFYASWLGKSQSARDIDGIKYEPGKPMPKLAALREAKSWLRSLTTADRERLTSASADQITETATRGGVEPLRGSASAPSSFDHPYYWAAFVLMGSPE